MVCCCVLHQQRYRLKVVSIRHPCSVVLLYHIQTATTALTVILVFFSQTLSHFSRSDPHPFISAHHCCSCSVATECIPRTYAETGRVARELTMTGSLVRGLVCATPTQPTGFGRTGMAPTLQRNKYLCSVEGDVDTLGYGSIGQRF